MMRSATLISPLRPLAPIGTFLAPKPGLYPRLLSEQLGGEATVFLIVFVSVIAIEGGYMYANVLIHHGVSIQGVRPTKHVGARSERQYDTQDEAAPKLIKAETHLFTHFTTPNNYGSLAIFTAMCRVSSKVGTCAMSTDETSAPTQHL
jgi:hypothetical protein